MNLKVDTWYSAAELAAELRPDLHLPQFTSIEERMGIAWLSEELPNWDSFGFNMRIGDTVQPPADFMPAIIKALKESSQKRVDIIARRGDRAAIVEVKVRVPIGALGQVLGYATIFQAENPSYRLIERIVVAGDAMIDVPELLTAYGVQLRLYRSLWLALGSPSE